MELQSDCYILRGRIYCTLLLQYCTVKEEPVNTRQTKGRRKEKEGARKKETSIVRLCSRKQKLYNCVYLKNGEVHEG
jgi:hypothetical protein